MRRTILVLLLLLFGAVGYYAYHAHDVSSPTPFAPADNVEFTARRAPDNPIIQVDMDPSLVDESKKYGYVNLNGPSLIRVPTWVENPLGKYYLYFAHHKGDFIKLAYADRPEGPWRIHPGGVLHVKDSGFAQAEPRTTTRQTVMSLWKNWSQTEFWTLLRVGLAAKAASKKLAAEGKVVSGESKPHIASPEVRVEEGLKEIRMYFHGLMDDGVQATRAAVSRDGLHFQVRPEVLSAPYLRVFKRRNEYYGLAMPGLLYRSRDGLTGFVVRPKPLAGVDMRHTALLPKGDRVYVFWTRVGDAPESILCSTLDVSSDDWADWKLTEPKVVLRPETPWEGGELPLEPSIRTEITVPARQLRDPAVYTEGDKAWLLYAAAGENAIAIADLSMK